MHRICIMLGTLALSHLAVAQEACPLTDLRIESKRHLSGLFTQNGFELRLKAELKNGSIVSTISHSDGALLSDLTIANGERVIPGLDAMVIEAALRLKERLAVAGANDKRRRADL